MRRNLINKALVTVITCAGLLIANVSSVLATEIDPNQAALIAQQQAIAAVQAQQAALAQAQAQQAALAQAQAQQEALAAAQAQQAALAQAQAQQAALAQAQAQQAALAQAQAQQATLAQTQAQQEALAAAKAQQEAIAAAQAQQAALAQATNRNGMTPSQLLADQAASAWFADAGFVGNSVSVGFASIAKKQYATYFGKSPMMAKESYSFMNDAKGNPKYRVSFNGYSGQAKDVIAKTGIRKVFINMGTNDLWEGPDKAYARYVEYIQGIRATNPGILIFIEATTPVMSGNEKGGLTNKNVDSLNAKMRAYCASSPDLFYIDINTPMKDSTGGLNPAYCSDKFVHINSAGYKVWVNTVISYVKAMNAGV